MTIPLARLLPAGSSCLPGPAGARWPRGLHRTRSLFGIAPGGACHAGAVTSPPVGSYPTVSPLPADCGRSVLCGAIPGVAPAGRYPAPSPHGVRTFLAARSHAVIQPSARIGIWPGSAGPSMGALPPPPVGGSPGIFEHRRIRRGDGRQLTLLRGGHPRFPGLAPRDGSAGGMLRGAAEV